MRQIKSRLSLVTAPTELPLDINEVKAHLRIEPTENDEDALVMAYFRSAVAHIDGRDGWLGRALTTQTWDYFLDDFPPATRFNEFAAIRLPLPPLQSVTSVKYTDSDGTQQTWATTNYTVFGTGDSARARIAPVFGEVWPVTRYEPDAVVIRFVAGYSDTSSNTQNAVPEPIRNALLLLTAHFYEERQPVSAGVSLGRVPMSVESLLAPYRV